VHVDCVIPVHQKDLWRLPYCVAGLRRNVAVGRINIVTARANLSAVDAAMADIGERAYRAVDECEFDAPPSGTPSGMPSRRRQWVLQQIIKMEAFRLVAGDYYLVLDADVLFLNPTPLFDDDGRVTVAVDAPRVKYRSHPLAGPCVSFCSVAHHLLGVEWRLHDVCLICHHMVFHVDTMKQMRAAIGGDWAAAIDRVIPVSEVWSEYDLYGYFVNAHSPATLVPRDAPWLDVPWTGTGGAALDAYLDRFRRAGVSFVALHHHYQDTLSAEDCVAFAADTCARLSSDDCRGRWPLVQWLAQPDTQHAMRLHRAPPGFGDLMGLVERAVIVAVTSMVVRYAHVRCGDGFAAAAALYTPAALCVLGEEVRHLEMAFSVFAGDVFLPLITAAIADAEARDRAMATIHEIQDRLITVAQLLSDETARAAVDPNRLSREIDAVRVAVGELFQGPAAMPAVLAAHPLIHWSGLDMQRWIPLARLITTSSPAIARPSCWLQQVLTDSQWHVIQPWFEQAPLFKERSRCEV
jgi:hypothetical protein